MTCAGDGAEACRLANESSYDAIILDIRMPVLDGLAAARRIRGTEGLAAERRVLTGLDDGVMVEIRQGLAAGERVIIGLEPKPVSRFRVWRF